MKRLLVCFVLMLLLGTATFGADIDLSSYTQDELIELRNRVDDTLKGQGYYGLIPCGVYAVGVDILSGRYVFSAPETDNPNYIGYISVYKSKEDYDNDDTAIIESVKEGYPYSVRLEDDEILEISLEQLCISSDKPAWAP